MFTSLEDPEDRIVAIIITLVLGAILIFASIVAVYNAVDNAYDYGTRACQGAPKDA